MPRTEKEKEKDRRGQRRLYSEYRVRRNVLISSMGGSCYLCSSVPVSGLHLHHIFYHPIESNYEVHAKTMHVRLKRLREAEKNPERFRLLCASCHTFITHIQRKCKLNNIQITKVKDCL